MTKKSSRKLVLPKECPRCRGEEWSQEELVMYGRYGTFGKGWRFWAFICQECGYTELYHKEHSAFSLVG